MLSILLILIILVISIAAPLKEGYMSHFYLLSIFSFLLVHEGSQRTDLSLGNEISLPCDVLSAVQAEEPGIISVKFNKRHEQKRT